MWLQSDSLLNNYMLYRVGAAALGPFATAYWRLCLLGLKTETEVKCHCYNSLNLIQKIIHNSFFLISSKEHCILILSTALIISEYSINN